MTQNQIAYWNLQESKRHNEAVETETQRANRKQEDLKSDIQESQKQVNESTVNLNRSKAKEADASTGLKDVQKGTERTKQFANIASGVNDMTGSFTNVTKGLTNILPIGGLR